MKSAFIKLFSRALFHRVFTVLFIFFFLFSQAVGVYAEQSMNPAQKNVGVIELLRLSVPKESRVAWLEAERRSWGPWLSKQKGFIERQLFWDEKREEAMILISWASKTDWKSIPQTELQVVQCQFEEFARTETGKKIGNPFPLNFEGELLPQL